MGNAPSRGMDIDTVPVNGGAQAPASLDPAGGRNAHARGKNVRSVSFESDHKSRPSSSAGPLPPGIIPPPGVTQHDLLSRARMMIRYHVNCENQSSAGHGSFT